MFSKLFNKKPHDAQGKKPKIQESYSMYQLQQNGKTFILRFNKWLWNIVGNSSYPFQVGIATSTKTTTMDFQLSKKMIDYFLLKI